ncbi:MAG TPA: MFS transporter [Microbacterium sp.]|nr:MFS transporter [Microbacterium sp.]
MRSPAAAALIGIIAIAVNLRSSTAGIGATLPAVQTDLGIPAALSAGLVVLPLLCYSAFAPISPVVERALGPRYTVVVALAVIAAGILLRSLPGSVLLWVGTGMLGAGIAVLNVVTPSIVKRTHPHRVPGVTSLYSAAQGGGAALATVLVAAILAHDPGQWRWALGSAIVFAVAGLAIWVPLAIGHRPRPATSAPPEPGPRARPNPWRQPLAWHIAGFMAMQSVVYYVLITWLPSIEQQAGTAPATTALHQTILQAAGLISALLGSTIMARSKSQRPIVVIATAAMTIGVAGVLVHPHLGALWCAVIGAAGGLTLVTALSLFGLRTHRHDETVAVSAMSQAIAYLAAAIAPSVVGLVHDITGNWSVPLYLLLLLLLWQLYSGWKSSAVGSVWQ